MSFLVEHLSVFCFAMQRNSIPFRLTFIILPLFAFEIHCDPDGSAWYFIARSLSLAMRPIHFLSLSDCLNHSTWPSSLLENNKKHKKNWKTTRKPPIPTSTTPLRAIHSLSISFSFCLSSPVVVTMFLPLSKVYLTHSAHGDTI